ncbi:MAG: hypothetical protein AB1345_06465 [Chloroflexota bacterium]
MIAYIKGRWDNQKPFIPHKHTQGWIVIHPANTSAAGTGEQTLSEAKAAVEGGLTEQPFVPHTPGYASSTAPFDFSQGRPFDYVPIGTPLRVIIHPEQTLSEAEAAVEGGLTGLPYVPQALYYSRKSVTHPKLARNA